MRLKIKMGKITAGLSLLLLGTLQLRKTAQVLMPTVTPFTVEKGGAPGCCKFCCRQSTT